MTVVRTIIFVFVWIFVVSILFVAFNTIFVGQIIPIFNDIANETSYVNYENYTARESQFTNIFYTTFFILYATPFLFLIVRLLFRREPTTGQGGFVNGLGI